MNKHIFHTLDLMLKKVFFEAKDFKKWFNTHKHSRILRPVVQFFLTIFPFRSPHLLRIDIRGQKFTSLKADLGSGSGGHEQLFGIMHFDFSNFRNHYHKKNGIKWARRLKSITMMEIHPCKSQQENTFLGIKCVFLLSYFFLETFDMKRSLMLS